MLVYRPQAELIKYKGYTVFVKSNDPTESMTKFEAICVELKVMLESLKEVL